jgi:hypothetical protein
MFDKLPRWFFYGMILAHIFAITGILIAFGDDTEDHGRLPLYDRLLKNAIDWNTMKLINETLTLSERFDK